MLSQTLTSFGIKLLRLVTFSSVLNRASQHASASGILVPGMDL